MIVKTTSVSNHFRKPFPADNYCKKYNKIAKPSKDTSSILKFRMNNKI